MILLYKIFLKKRLIGLFVFFFLVNDSAGAQNIKINLDCIANTIVGIEKTGVKIMNEKDKLFEDTNRIKISSIRNAKYYTSLKEEGDYIDVTEDVLRDPYVKEAVKKNITKNKRKILTFLYKSDSFLVPGFISYVPEAENANLVFNIRGGYGSWGVFNPSEGSEYYKNTIVGTQYRGSLGEGKDEFGGSEVIDIFNLLKFLPSIELKIKKNISLRKRYIIGNSRGGMEVMLALSRFPEIGEFFNFVILSSPLYSIDDFCVARPDMYNKFKRDFELATENKKNIWLTQRAVISSLDKIKSNVPFLIFQGTKDFRVALSHGVSLYNDLSKSGHSVKYIEVKSAAHCLSNCINKYQLYEFWMNSMSEEDKESN